MHTGPKLTNGNLVFGYDTGYGIADNDTSTRFYPGEPTVNVLANTNPGYGGLTLGSDSGGTYILTSSGTSGYNYIKVPSITVTSNETYTWSFELKSEETITQSGNKYYFDTNEFSNEFSSSNDLSRVTWNQIRPSSLPAGEWVKFSLSVTMKPNLTGAYSYDFLNFIKPQKNFTSKKIYYRNMQFENNKSRHTPFVNGSRSDTASLIDLKKTVDIDMDTVSFDSTGQPEFDGTDDFLTIAHHASQNFTGDFTIEAVFKPTGNAAACLMSKGSGNDYYQNYWLLCDTRSNLLQVNFIMANSSNNGAVYTTTDNSVITIGAYHHIVATVLGTTSSVYVNGVSVGTNRNNSKQNSTNF